MFSSLVLGTALLSPGAPVPADSLSNPTGPAPRIAYPDGKVRLAHNPSSHDTQGFQDEQLVMNRGGGGVMVVGGRVQRMGFDASAPGVQPGQTKFPGKPLDDVKFDAYDLKGDA